jgi:hypothetical protein
VLSSGARAFPPPAVAGIPYLLGRTLWFCRVAEELLPSLRRQPPRPIERLLAHPGQRLNSDEHVVFDAVFGADHALADGFHTR